MRRIMTMLLMSALCLAVGCSEAPNETLGEAEKMVLDAQIAGARAYVPEDFAKLQGMLNNAKTEMADQNRKYVLFRDFDKTEQLLASVKVEATKVIESLAKKKAAAKDEAIKAQAAAIEAVKKTQARIAKAQVGKDQAAVEAIKNAARALTASLSEVQAAMDMQDYLTAHTKAKAVQDKSLALATEVGGAPAKAGQAAMAKDTNSAK